jgi:hypothetical protein
MENGYPVARLDPVSQSQVCPGMQRYLGTRQHEIASSL